LIPRKLVDENALMNALNAIYILLEALKDDGK
jgi:hypothetical protein